MNYVNKKYKIKETPKTLTLSFDYDYEKSNTIPFKITLAKHTKDNEFLLLNNSLKYIFLIEVLSTLKKEGKIDSKIKINRGTFEKLLNLKPNSTSAIWFEQTKYHHFNKLNGQDFCLEKPGKKALELSYENKKLSNNLEIFKNCCEKYFMNKEEKYLINYIKMEQRFLNKIEITNNELSKLKKMFFKENIENNNKVDKDLNKTIKDLNSDNMNLF